MSWFPLSNSKTAEERDPRGLGEYFARNFGSSVFASHFASLWVHQGLFEKKSEKGAWWRLWKCYEKHERPKFSIKTGSIMEDSPIALDKWLTAMWLIVNCKNGISSCEIARDLKITQKSAWFLDHRIRAALHSGSVEKLSGEVEVDETYIGGKARNMHRDRRAKVLGQHSGPFGKLVVQGLLERHGGRVHARVVGQGKHKPLLDGIVENVETGSTFIPTRLLLTITSASRTMPTRSSGMLRNTWTGKCIPTPSRTSGHA